MSVLGVRIYLWLQYLLLCLNPKPIGLQAVTPGKSGTKQVLGFRVWGLVKGSILAVFYKLGGLLNLGSGVEALKGSGALFLSSSRYYRSRQQDNVAAHLITWASLMRFFLALFKPRPKMTGSNNAFFWGGGLFWGGFPPVC